MMNIPTKPQDVTFTDAQWRAIWAKGQDMLVSAAAGSGKTKVLITRMIEKVLDEKNPIDVDQLLVVTFTNAAAAEMRQRMATALEEEIEKNPTSTHLRKQLSLLNKAHISTLHSFCQSMVRQYAYLLDIDPGFRVADSSEAALLRDDAIHDVLEEAYSEDNPQSLYELVDRFTTDRDDQLIETLISRLYDYSRVHPQPTVWLAEIPTVYQLEEAMTIDELSFIEPLKDAIRYALEEAIALIGEMKRIADMPDGPGPLLATAEADLTYLTGALEIVRDGTWEEAYTYFQSLKWVRAGAIKKDSCDENLAKRAKALREQAKKVTTSVQESYFLRRPEYLLDEIRSMAPSMALLVELVGRFGERYQQAKIERGIVDFSDLEHYALTILSEEQDGVLQPSEIAMNYQQQFAEILVDEYQDVNFLQETILQLVKSNDEATGNLFMVGDVKQAIYGFRLAEPNLFLEKYDCFKHTGEDRGLKIDLNANFRSRKEVLEGTNFIFSQIMGSRVGGIDYDEAAALKYGAKFPEKSMPTKFAVLYEPSEEMDLEEELTGQSLKSVQAEARYIASEIKQLMANGAEVTNAFTNEKRPIAYRDVVILMRSMTWTGEIVEEFKKQGIPIFAEVSKGYFEAIEVMVMLNVLSVIDNPYQDIPLASMLRAPFIGLKENELAKIRLAAPKEQSFYEALQLFIAKGGSGIELSTQQKLERFFTYFEAWRNAARHGSLADLIWQVYSDTYYYEMVGMMPNGKQKQANLRALHDRAIAYEKTSFRGLFRFLRFVDRMKKRGDDFGEARALTESEDVVRLMTIHASKGLEFPYVFVAGIGRQFNKMDLKERYLFDKHFGLAVKGIDPERRLTYTSLPFLAVKEKKELEMRAEEMRILYVAMTRAQESLTLVASVKDLEKEFEKWLDAQLVDPNAMLPEYTRSRANSYLDWVGPAIARHPEFEKFDRLADGRFIDSASDWSITMQPFHQFVEAEQIEEIPAKLEQQELADDDGEQVKVQKRFDWRYSFKEATEKRSKQSVSELKRLALLEQEEENLPTFSEMKAPTKQQAYLHRQPAFMQKRAVSAAEIGTAVHAIMEQAQFEENYTIEKLDVLIETLVNRQLLTAEEAAAVDRSEIVAFFKHPLVNELRSAKRIYRELPFTYAYDGDGDPQILQGIVDCLFETENGWAILDYKTDWIREGATLDAVEQEMHKRYGIQLNLYKEAMESILKIEIKEMLVYLFATEQVIHIEERGN